MCIGNTTSPASNSQQTINWGRGPWDERPPLQVGDQPDTDATGPNVTSKNKSTLKTKPKAQSSKSTGGAY